MIESLYVHIPFCSSICSYCSFNKRLYNQKLASEYVDNLILDLKRIPKKSLKTIYIGGGTPCSLSNKDLDKLLFKLKNLLKENYEFTIESNPENLLDIEKIHILSKHGINRVSIGVQTFNINHLDRLGRKHTINDINDAINNLLKFNINNINFDMIYGLPNQTLDEFIDDVNQALKYPIKHISLYSLTIDENTIFNNLKLHEADEDLLRDMSDVATDILKKKGFIKYEVSNYSLNGYESIHNLTYWYDNEYYGIGVSASGYENGIRYTNDKNLSKYLEDKRIKKEEIIDEYNHEYEYIMLNLRTKYGIDLIKYQSIFNKDFLCFYKNELELLKEFLIIDNNFLHVKDNNFMILNTIILKFINKLEEDYNG